MTEEQGGRVHLSMPMEESNSDDLGDEHDVDYTCSLCNGRKNSCGLISVVIDRAFLAPNRFWISDMLRWAPPTNSTMKKQGEPSSGI